MSSGYWIAAVLLILGGIYLGSEMIQALGFGMIVLPFVFIALILAFLAIVLVV